MLERARDFAQRLEGDARVECRRIELLVPEQPRATMRTFYVIAIESSADRDPVFASAVSHSARDLVERSLGLVGELRDRQYYQ